MLSGESIFLRPMEMGDVPLKVKWINDPEVRHTLNFDYPLSEVGTAKWLQTVALDPSRRDFVICRALDQQPIGYAGFQHIDYRNRKAETYGGIGEKSEWGKGYGKEFKKILLRYGFVELGLNKITSHVWVKNRAMITINKQLGMSEDGILREDVFSHGEYRDRLVMAILREEYFATLE